MVESCCAALGDLEAIEHVCKRIAPMGVVIP